MLPWHAYRSIVIDRTKYLSKCKQYLRFNNDMCVVSDRARKFPALINCTNIDWFHEWPEEALVSVSQRFLSEVKELPVRHTPTRGDFDTAGARSQ